MSHPYCIALSEKQKALFVTYFVDIVHLDDVVKEAVEIVEERHHLHRRTDRTHGGEAHDVREEDGHHFVATWLY